MKRIDKIYDYLEKKTRNLKSEELLAGSGVTATEIAEDLDILRNNVSKELNELHRLGKIIKIKGRPVLYIHKAVFETVFSVKLPDEPIEISNINEIITDGEIKDEDQDPFALLIGAQAGLKNPIEQAKAAVLYPPNGLHTLIVGQTGVGKTLFASMMYNYARYAKKLDEKSPFIIFNCADYYNNPQLLLSHIFGHIKGAFTGADCEKHGLVEKADGGILFLDEIHRLPPEGQEMIFYFMDTGTYNKLGETERTRKANVLMIGATTEDPNSYMLKTFIRRIPIIINIPSLEERSIEEKIDIIKHLLSKESHRVNKPIKVSSEVIKALIGSSSYGNIGQLKSNIQLICAKGFLNSISNDECIELDFKKLPTKIKDGLFNIGNRSRELEQIGSIIESSILVTPKGYKVILEDPCDPPFNLYKIIEDKASVLKDEGMDDEYINKFITTDINIHIKSFYDKFNNDKNKKERILKIVEKDVLEFSEEVKRMAEKDLKRRYSDRFVYALSLHLSAFFKRIKNEKSINDGHIESVIKDRPEELKVALKIKALIEEKYKFIVPEVEVMYIAVLLSSVEDVGEGKVGILVAAHGNSTASSMANVVNRLLGEGIVYAVDMPLEVSPKDILEIIIEKVKQIDMGEGVLLLVDMGSLYNFESVIMERTGIKIKTIDMVSTPLVLEAARKTNIFGMNLDDIYNSLRNFKGYATVTKEIRDYSNKVIITICSSGKGAAVKLKELVEDIIYNLTEERITVVTVGASDLDNKIEEIRKKHDIIAAIGIKKPNIDLPFIPLEMLIDGNGEKLLKEVIVNNNISISPKKENIVLEDLSEDLLKQFLTYLNPHKIISVLLKFISVLECELRAEFSNSMKIRIIVHVGCALERMVINDGLNYSGDKTQFNEHIVRAVDKACTVFEDTLRLAITMDEKLFIYEMLN